KAFAGEVVPFRVIAFREGHDRIGVHLRLTAPDGTESLHRLTPLQDGTDEWQVHIALDARGTWRYRFEAFGDDFATWAHAAAVKIAAGVDVAVMTAAGAELFARAAAEKDRPAAERRRLAAAASDLGPADAAGALDTATSPEFSRLFAQRPLRSLISATELQSVLVERERAGVGAWYEFFPRSEGAKRTADGRIVSGTFRTAAKRLAAVADMGFEVVYLPPIHPNGRTHRKGRNNTLHAGDDDPG